MSKIVWVNNGEKNKPEITFDFCSFLLATHLPISITVRLMSQPREKIFTNCHRIRLILIRICICILSLILWQTVIHNLGTNNSLQNYSTHWLKPVFILIPVLVKSAYFWTLWAGSAVHNKFFVSNIAKRQNSSSSISDLESFI